MAVALDVSQIFLGLGGTLGGHCGGKIWSFIRRTSGFASGLGFVSAVETSRSSRS